MTSDKFLFDDPRLCDYELDRIERNVLANVVSSGRLPLEDVNFLRLWESGTYFQTAPVPVLFPFDENIADVAKSTGRFRHFSYYDDVEVVHDGVRYRLLKLKSERALSVLLNWLKERGVSDSELKLAYCRGNGSDEHSDLGLGKSPLKCKTESHAKKSVKVLGKKQSAEVMASIRRYSDGSILASDVKTAFNMQIRKHGYKPSAFAKGVGLEYSFVMKWCRGGLVIRPDEMKVLCRHLGVANLFEDLPLTVLTKEQKLKLKTAHEKTRRKKHMESTVEHKGKCGPYIAGGVVVTPEIFQRGIDCTGKNIEISVRKGTLLDCVLSIIQFTGAKPKVVLKKKVELGGEVVVGGECHWEGASQIVSERGVFDVFEGKLYSYLFADDVRSKMVDFFCGMKRVPSGGAAVAE